MAKTPITIRPRGQYVLVKPDAAESRKNSLGIILPSNVEQEQKAVGTVLAVSPDVPDIKKGNRVIYGVFAGETMKYKVGTKEEEYKLLHSDDIIAFVE